jgi:FkbM family methyltransferase
MLYLRERSLQTPDPVFQALRKDGLLFPDIPDIAYDFALKGSYEGNIIEWAAHLIDPTTVFLDIGAHVGTYSLAFAQRCAGVHSFECSPKTFNYLCANIALRDLHAKITPHRCALGSEAGVVPYYEHSPDGGGNSCHGFGRTSESVNVEARTLDSFHLDNIGLIKIDVEGFEVNVLRGAVETLKRSHYPRILFESWRPEREAEGIPAVTLRQGLFDELQLLGYTIHPVRGWDEMFIADHTQSASTP